METIRTFRWIAGFAVLAVAATGALAVASSQQVASGGDSYSITAQRLRSKLTNTGIELTFLHPPNEPTTAVVGVAGSAPGEQIGFEYQLYPSSDEAKVANLGKLPPRVFGWRKPSHNQIFEPIVRGVLGNVAYAIYELWSIERRKAPRLEALERHWNPQRTLRALDNALFESFPSGDPYANPLSATP
jgi:hypothetical protein